MWANFAAAQKKLAGGLAQATHLAGDVLADMKAEYADREDVASEEEEDEATGKPFVRMHPSQAQNDLDSSVRPFLGSTAVDGTASELEGHSQDKDLELAELREKVAVLTKDANREIQRVQQQEAERALSQARDFQRDIKVLQSQLETATSQINALRQEQEEDALKKQEQLQQQTERERKKLRESMTEQEQRHEQQAQELSTLTAEVSRLKKELLAQQLSGRSETSPDEAGNAFVQQLESLEQQKQEDRAQVRELQAALQAMREAHATDDAHQQSTLQQAKEQVQHLQEQMQAQNQAHSEALARMQTAAHSQAAEERQSLTISLQQTIDQLAMELAQAKRVQLGEYEEKVAQQQVAEQLQQQLQTAQNLLEARQEELAQLQLQQSQRQKPPATTGVSRYFEDPQDVQSGEGQRDEDANAELAAQRGLIADLTSRNAELLAHQAQLETKLASLAPTVVPDEPGPTEQLAVLKAELERLQQEVREGDLDKAEVARLRQELLSQETEQTAREDQLAAQVTELQAQQMRDTEALKELSSQQEAAKQLEQTLRAEYQSSSEKAAEMGRLVEGLRREVADKSAHITTLGKGKEEIMVELTSELEKAQNERGQVEALLLTCQKQYEGAVNQIKKLQQECRDACHNEDGARQKASQADGLAAKYKAELSALQTRLDRVLQNQADTQEGAQEEQSHLLEQIASLKGEVAGHQAMVDRLNKDIQVRAIRESEIREVAERELAAKELEVKLAATEAERLRTHLREAAEGTKDEHEEVYQLNQQLRAELRQLQLDAAATSSLATDLAELQKAFDLKNRECESHSLALANLEGVLAAFQREASSREHRLAAELTAKRAEAEGAARELTKFHTLEDRLGVAEKVAADSKNELLVAQRHSMALTGENSALRGRLAKFQQHPTDQNLVDRRIVVKMLMAYFERTDKEDVIQVMYRMFQFSAEERDAVDRSRRNSGLKSGIAKVASLLSPFDEPPAPLKEGDGNLADLWVDFLLKESSKKDNPRRPSAPSSYPSSSQQSAPPSPPSSPAPADLAALPPLVSGHYPSIRPKIITSTLSSSELLARHGPRSSVRHSDVPLDSQTTATPTLAPLPNDEPRSVPRTLGGLSEPVVHRSEIESTSLTRSPFSSTLVPPNQLEPGQASDPFIQHPTQVLDIHSQPQRFVAHLPTQNRADVAPLQLPLS